MKRCLLLVTACALGLAPCGCVAPRKNTIGLSVLTLSNPFFKEIADAMTEEAGKHGFDVVVTSGNMKADIQHNQVQDFLARGVDAIVLCPCDSKAVATAIREANEAGVPVFTADIACLDKSVQVVSHIATDNYEGGKMAGHAMIKALGKSGGKIVILDFFRAESCILRVKGFKEVIEAHNKGRTTGRIEIMAKLPGEGAKDRGYKAAADALQAHPDLAGIFAINDPSALGARAAVEKAGRTDQLKIIGFDGQLEGLQAIKDGKIYADPIQFPDKIGRKTVQEIVKYFRGEEVRPEILIATELYYRADGMKDSRLK
jgi:ribose transport system substrate-binding protein